MPRCRLLTNGLPLQHRRALDAVHDRLADRNVPWAITGSAALALHGLRVPCRDLDLVTTAAGASDMEEAFIHEVVARVGFRMQDGIRGHRGVLRIEGVRVEVLGEHLRGAYAAMGRTQQARAIADAITSAGQSAADAKPNGLAP